ncbi:Hsp33 family molecular chaperone HslO [Endozoicomonas sp. SM1973]|uniref:33 kDa chaperonin n=1 Tax=Spartinivicinus marinus TaxID=2994442 RepID=A0A853I5G7_9GAMM|nr:Hsp33 family molecular chaperone HslO [Spartinivicinus marinus]MCX4027104.1 Hsp33 family molecular chaperone HslO [Spartinivicinus marinus]NYZ68583.1 Hsp33 family molecular chaperone HslO [Spartinivicinus marinus]
MSNTKDIAQRFSFDDTAVRGEIVSLEDSYQQALANHDYPPVIRQLLGELIASAILLSSTLKFEGTLTLQARSEGSVTLLMAECNEKRQFRAVASWKEDVNNETELSSLMPNGVLSITVDPKGKKRYQGVVSTNGVTLADCLANYFKQSEQLATRFWVFSDQSRVSGMLLQALPDNNSEEQQEAWQRINCLADTITAEELLSLEIKDVLHRLFHEENVRLYEPHPAEFKCSCSKERTAKALLTLGYAEVTHILQEQQQVSMDCQFCGAHYEFSAPEVEQLFDAPDGDGAAPVVH